MSESTLSASELKELRKSIAGLVDIWESSFSGVRKRSFVIVDLEEEKTNLARLIDRLKNDQN